ncbi:hypothetical protein C1708_06715 [Streptomyces sp. DH-12]|uniref:hypothetical protein n=1 Tax=Streptomyces sp. DH-12 TaxID=2072509 RepID=UPI000CCF42D2|nr:hypothetical protein [Streptomyces sp. DH-12]PNV32021.1 hypothetical protein C1708_06715 [Streptomyces sp. DH-12]
MIDRFPGLDVHFGQRPAGVPIHSTPGREPNVMLCRDQDSNAVPGGGLPGHARRPGLEAGVLVQADPGPPSDGLRKMAEVLDDALTQKEVLLPAARGIAA